MRIQNNEGGRADKRLMFAAPFVFAAAIMLGVKLALAWVAPDVAITSPASYATLSGSVPVSVSYDVKAGNDYSVHLLVDGAVVETLDVHSKSGTIVFDWDSTMVANGAHTLVARAYSAAAPSSHYGDSVPVNVTVNNSAAPVDTDAPSLSLTSPADGATVNTASVNVSGTVSDAMSGVDTVTVNGADAIISGNSFNLNGVTLNEGQNTITVTATDNAGNSISKTISVTYTPPVVIPPACGSDSDCSDDNALTLDYCTKPGTAQAACVNTAIVCNSAADCDDNDTHTLDACTNGGTTSAACRHDNIACLNNSECNDGNALTLDNCQNPGAPQSACAHTAIACNSAADCNDGNDQTTDSCTNPGTVQSACLHTPVAQPPVEDTTTPPPADTTAPALSITSPTNGATVNVSSVNITGTVSDAGGVAWVRVNGVDAIINGNSFSLNNIELNEGANTITVTATDNSGNPAVASVEVVYAPPVVTPPVVTPPALTLDVSSPSDGLVTNNVKVAVSGTTIPGAVVTVNGAAASVGAGGAISYTGALNEGANTVTVKACANGECLTESRSVVVDTRKPDITGAEEDGADVLVYMQDNAGGTGLDEGALLVQIDGYEAAGTYDKTKKAFRAKGLALGVGSHTVTASAADRAGNVAQSAMSLNKSGGDGNVSIAIEDVPGKISGVTAAGTSAGSVYGPMPEPGVQVTGMQQAASWSFSPATTQTGNLSQPVSGGTELQKFFSELYGKTHPKWPVFAGTGESMVKNAPPKLKCSDLDKGLSDTSSGSEASVLSVDGDIVAAVDAPRQGEDWD